MLDPSATSIIGQMVPDYDLLKRIGKGAFGEVWLARNKATGILRAAKIVWRNTFEEERPYQREFEGLLRFERISQEHPSQLKLLHVGRNDAEGYFYYVMELADGVKNPNSEVGGTKSETTRAEREAQHSSNGPSPDEGVAAWDSYRPRTLRADLANGRLPAETVVEIGLALAEALGHLHSNGLVHRDVKPSNVIFVNGRPKLADIGLVTDASDRSSIVGTEGYLPPEGPGTPQADIFALGKVLYEASTGMDRHRFPDLPGDVREWPERNAVFELNAIVLKACASDARNRYSSAQQIESDLRLLQTGSSVRRGHAVRRFWERARRAAISVAALTVLAGAVMLVSRSFTRSEPDPGGPPSTDEEANILSDK